MNGTGEEIDAAILRPGRGGAPGAALVGDDFETLHLWESVRSMQQLTVN
jgi:hypothetical protein